MNGLRPRWFGHILDSALRVLPVTVVTGARQTGKTTLVKSTGPGRTYFTLDDIGVLDQAGRNPEALLDSRPVTLDEVQRTPALLLAVKRAVDEHRQAGDFLLTGSANLLLMGRVTGSGAAGIRAFRESLKKKSVLVRSAVLHAGQARPLDTDLAALPWGWMVAEK